MGKDNQIRVIVLNGKEVIIAVGGVAVFRSVTTASCDEALKLAQRLVSADDAIRLLYESLEPGETTRARKYVQEHAIADRRAGKVMN